jgi:hypothetical protein
MSAFFVGKAMDFRCYKRAYYTKNYPGFDAIQQKYSFFGISRNTYLLLAPQYQPILV